MARGWGPILYICSTPYCEACMVQRNGGARAASRPSARPKIGQRGKEIQGFGTMAGLPIGLDEDVCQSSAEALTETLAGTICLRDRYKKHQWQVAGHRVYELDLLCDKHYGEQSELVDLIAERIQILGGISVAMAPDVAEETRIPRPPRGREEVPVQISRLLEAHELILTQARAAAREANEAGDDGTNDLLVSNVIRTNEMQVGFRAEPLLHATG